MDAQQVDSPAGRLGGTVLLSPTDRTIGTLDGVVIDPVERRVCYFVVGTRRWFSTKRYLLPVVPARLDGERRTLAVDLEADELERCAQIDEDRYPAYSDEDLINALFSSRAA